MYNYNVNPINIQPYLAGRESNRRRDEQQSIKDLRDRVLAGDVSALQEYAMIDPQGAATYQSMNKPAELNPVDVVQFSEDAKSAFPLIKSGGQYGDIALNNLSVKYANTPFEQAISGFSNLYGQNPEAAIAEYANFVGQLPAEEDKPKTAGEKVTNYEYYEKLLKTNPEGAERFAQSANLNPQERSSLAVETSRLKKQDKERIDRITGFASSGVEAADNLAGVKRTIELLDSVKTGGFDNAAFKAKSLFGIEAADEGELSFLMSKNVLSQLKTIFGAAFTAQEGERLEKIEASFGRNTETNKRLLDRVFKSTERAARRGIRAAEEIGDDFTANEIRVALDRVKDISINDPIETETPSTNDRDEQSILNQYGL